MPSESTSLDMHEGPNLSNLNLPPHGIEMMSEFSLKGDHQVVDASIVDESSIVDASVVDLPQLQDTHHHVTEYRIATSNTSPKNTIDAIVNHQENRSHSSETTTIDGVVYNSRGYEVCGHLNQHNKPCQRIGRCPFHHKDKKEGEASPIGVPISEQVPTPPPPVSSTITLSPPHIEKKEPTKTPMKTPYKQGWTKDEHIRFLNGLQIHGKGAWKEIAQIVNTRTPTQIQSHAQKYYLRQKQSVKNKRSIHDLTIEDLQEMQDPSLRGKSHVMVTNGNPNAVNLNTRPAIQYSYTTVIPGLNHSSMYQTTQSMSNPDPSMMYYQRSHMQGPMVDQGQYSQMRSPQMQTIHMQSGMQTIQMQPMSSMSNSIPPIQLQQQMSHMNPMSPMTSSVPLTPMQAISPMQNMQAMQNIQPLPSAYSHIGTSHLPSINQVPSTPTQLPSLHYTNWFSPTTQYSPYTYSQHIPTGNPMQAQLLQSQEDRNNLPSVRHDESQKDYWGSRNQNHSSQDEEEENHPREKRFPDFLTQDDNPREKQMRRIDDEDKEEDEEEEGDEDSNRFLVAEGDD